MSCRSRAIRSRSSSTASRARSACASATSSASASCSPNPATLGRSSCGRVARGPGHGRARRSSGHRCAAAAPAPTSPSVQLAQHRPDAGQLLGERRSAARPSPPNRAEPVARALSWTRASTAASASSRGQAAGEPRRRGGRRLQPQLVLARLAVGAGVTDRDTRGGGERDRDLLVARGEVHRGAVRTQLVGEVEVAEHRTAGAHRDAEERVHRRVVRREADRRRVVGEVVQPQHVRGGREVTEHAPALGQVTDQQRRLARRCPGTRTPAARRAPRAPPARRTGRRSGCTRPRRAAPGPWPCRGRRTSRRPRPSSPRAVRRVRCRRRCRRAACSEHRSIVGIQGLSALGGDARRANPGVTQTDTRGGEDDAGTGGVRVVVREHGTGRAGGLGGHAADGCRTSPCCDVAAAPRRLPPELELLVVGAPTQAFGMSRPRDARGRAAAGRGRARPARRSACGSGSASSNPPSARCTPRRSTPGSTPRTSPVPPRSAPGGCCGATASRSRPRRRASGCWGSSGPLRDGELDRARSWGVSLVSLLRGSGRDARRADRVYSGCRRFCSVMNSAACVRPRTSILASRLEM